MARSLGLPMVGQVHGLIDHVQAGRRIAIDGRAGTVDLEPVPEVVALAVMRPANRASARPRRAAPGVATETSCDRPGVPRVEANVNLLSEAERVVAHAAGAVGLYRSEMIFLARRTLPTEEEQVEIYRKLIEALRGRRVTIRTFDLRPDKLAQGSSVASSSAHALDWRLVLEAPNLQRLFKEQVRAILRAAAAGPVRLLVPLVNRSALLDFARTTVDEARRELIAEGLPFGADVPFGAMIEATAAIPLAGSWAGRVDFFALGTNDLAASALGLSREDPVGARSDDVVHPGLIRMIASLIDAAHKGGRPVSTCGEMASDPAGTVVLAALGTDSLSVAVDRLADVRRTLIGLDPAALPSLRSRLLEAESAEDVARLVGGFVA
jgi:phosphoenolpyruvate-protein kinase (PTS system EI component)